MDDKVDPPTEAEKHQLRQDAAANVAGAHAALGGDEAALAEWRSKQTASPSK